MDVAEPLPAEVLSRIFAYLPDADRCRARLACRLFAEVMQLGELWRERRFTFTGQDQQEGQRAVHYMRTLGGHLRHLHVYVTRPLVGNEESLSRALTLFFSAHPAESRLVTFVYIGPANFPNWLEFQPAHQEAGIVQALSSLLSQQKCLEKLQLSHVGFSTDNATEVLKALACNTDMAASTVELRNLSRSQVSIKDWIIFWDEVSRFSMLTHVGLNFTYLSDNVLLILSENSKSLHLCLLLDKQLHAQQWDALSNNYELVTSGGWRFARERCSQLTVAVEMTFYEDYQRVLLSDMPLTRLTLSSPYFESQFRPAHFVRLLRHLVQNFSASLQAFVFNYLDCTREEEQTHTWTWAQALVELVSGCPYLTQLTLMLTLTADTVKQLALATVKGGSVSSLDLHVDCVDGFVDLSELSKVNRLLNLRVVR